MSRQNHERDRSRNRLDVSRRSVLKAAGASAAGAALFSAPASANDDTAFFDIECFEDTVRVTLNKLELDGGGTAFPTELEDLRVYLGTEENVARGGAGDEVIDARAEIEPCFFDEGTKSDAFCENVAFPESTEIVRNTVVYTFDRAAAGLDGDIDPATVNDSVVLAGVYRDPDGNLRKNSPPRYQSFDSLGRNGERTVGFDTADCPCTVCGDDGTADGVSELTLRNASNETLSEVKVYNDKEAKSEALLGTFTNVAPGEDINFSATTLGEDKLKNDISVYVDGQKNAKIHTSCSKPLGPGIKKGDFLVVSGVDASGDRLCSVDCAKCGDGGEGEGVSEITFRNERGSSANVTVYNDKEAKDDAVLFDETVADGGLLTVSAPAGEDELKNDISIYVGDERVAVFHTSCSRLFGPGSEEGGFTVVAGRDKAGRPLCDLDRDDCVECGTGADDAEKVSELTFRFLGEDDSTVEIYNDKEDKADKLLFGDTDVDNGEEFTVEAPIEKDEFESDISLWVDGSKNTEFHTSCSQPLGRGIVKGDFRIVGGKDRNGRPLCDIGCATCGDGGEAEGVSQLTFENTSGGGLTQVTVYNDKEEKSDAVLFGPTDVATGDTLTISAPAGEDVLKSDISIYVDSDGDGTAEDRVAVIHTSCSRLLGPGTEEGGFTVVSGRDKAGRALCDLDLDDCVECGTGADDAEKVSELTFRFLGDDGSTVEVYNDKEAKEEVRLFKSTLDGGDRFTVEAPIEKDEFESDISVWVDGQKNAEFHTSCSQPLGRGIVKGDFRIVGGKDRNGRPLCDVGCATCGDGGEADGVSQLRFRNVSGGPLEDVTVYNDKEAKDDAVLYGPRDRAAGQRFAVTAPADKDKLESDISIYAGGERVAVIHTSCSQLLGPGSEEGGFAVVSGRDKAGRALCDLDLTGCRECGTGADDAEKVSELTLRNDSGGSLTDVAVYNDKEAKSEELLFGPIDVAAGARFTVEAPPEKDEFESDISVWVDGSKNTEIHTSCSQPLGPGLTFGDFYVAGAKDKNGYSLCKIEDDGPSGCVECGTGEDDAERVAEMTFEYQGADGNLVQFYDGKEAKSEDLLFEGTLIGGETFTVTAADGEFETDTSIYVDGTKNTTVHTSCSQPLGPGLLKGDFLITDAKDTNGRELCELGCVECGEGEDDADGISQLTLRNDGSGGTVTVYNDKEAKSDAEIFSGSVGNGEEFTFSAPSGEDKLKSDISVYVDGSKDTGIHTSCSQPLGVGDTFGSFTVTGGRDKASRELCDDS